MKPEDMKGEFAGLSAMINARLRAETSIVNAKAFGWLCTGAAISVILAGMGCATALVGYSYMNSVEPAAELVALALAKTFKEIKLQTTVHGAMSLAADSELKLAPSQTVRLDDTPPIKLDPNSSVRIVGNLKLDVPQPSKQQLQLDATSTSNELPFTNYTIFREVLYDKGSVVTGWSYDLSDTMRPRYQTCYYQQSLDKGVSAKYTIAVNNTPQRPSSLTKLTFDFDGAVTNCIWFSGY
jgi:hypothetical protein